MMTRNSWALALLLSPPVRIRAVASLVIQALFADRKLSPAALVPLMATPQQQITSLHFAAQQSQKKNKEKNAIRQGSLCISSRNIQTCFFTYVTK